MRILGYFHLLNMPPDPARDDSVNGRRSNAMPFAEGDNPAVLSWDVRSTNRFYRLFINDGHWVGFTSVVMSGFLSVAHVIGWCSEVKVIGVYANRIIAAMENLKRAWNRAVNFNPCYLVNRANARSAVSVMVCWACPVPASIGLDNASPKPLYGPSPVSRVVAFYRAVFARAASPSLKRLMAFVAGASYLRFSHARVSVA